MNILKTEYSFFDIYLSKFINKKNNILEINSDKGYITKWFLKYLCNNKNSTIITIDTWNKSEEYKNFKITINEHLFNKNINSTTRELQVIKMKMETDNAIKIIKNNNNKKFNIIYIDASYFNEALMSNCILAFELLEDGGIIIFDDYVWDDMNNEFFYSKITIDVFLYTFRTKIKILNNKYQIILQKNIINIDNTNKDYYKIFNNIENYSTCDLWYEINNYLTQPLHIKLELSNKINNYIDEYENDINYKKILNNNSDILYNNYYNKYQLNTLLTINTDFSILYDKLPNIINNEIIRYGFNPFEIINKIKLIIGNNTENIFYETISKAINNNLLNKKDIKTLDVINFSYFEKNNKNVIIDYLKKKFNIEKIILKNINSKMYNIDELEKIVKNVNKKQDIIIISLFTEKLLKIKKYYTEKYYTLQFLYCIVFLLSLSKIGSCGVVFTFSFFTKISIELLWILKKYYKKMFLSCHSTTDMCSRITKIYVSDFIGISDEELKSLIIMCNKIKKYNKKYDEYDNNDYKYIKNILNIDKNTIEYLNFKNKIIDFNIINIKIIEKNILLWYDIVKFLNDNTKNNDQKNKLKDVIMEKQITVLFSWYNNYNF
jgi:hypothetical protein